LPRIEERTAYQALVQIDPNNIPVQFKDWLLAIAKRSQFTTQKPKYG
jgi:hypothetical protein